MEIMSDEEVAARDRRVRELYASLDLKSKIAAILMDTSIGSLGLFEETAWQKADAIKRLIEEKSLGGN